MLVYLDQSTLSYVASPEGLDLQTQLLTLVRSDKAVCLASPEHTDESRLAVRSYEQLHGLLDQLSMGISFKWDSDIRESEIMNAAAEFSGAPQPFPGWREAFEKDPHTPIDRLYPGGFRLFLGAQNLDWQRAEVERRKVIPPELDEIYRSVRASGRTLSEQACREFQGAIRGHLAPFLHPGRFFEQLGQLYTAAIAERTPAELVFGPAMSRYMNAKRQWDYFQALCRQYPQVLEDPAAFLTSESLWRCPSLQFPSLLFAATALASKNRKAKAGDDYDRSHLTLALSRCEIATADHGMAQMCRDRRLIPAAVRLFSSREHGALLEHLRTLQ